VHLLIRKHRDRAERMIENLQLASRVAVLQYDLRFPNHPVWTEGGWKGFEESVADMRRTIRYIELNPVKIGRPRQFWEFVTPYDGWLPGIVTKAKPQANRQPPRNSESG
jgi:hypothetical protein